LLLRLQMNFKCYIILQVSKDTLCFVANLGEISKIESDRQKRLRQMFDAEEINIALVYVFSLLVIPHIVLT